MAKEELFVKHGKAVNHFLRALGAFPVKRAGDTKAIEQAIEILEQGGLLGIFPQEAIVAHGIPFQPKSGIAMIAYHAKAPVLPVSITTNGDIKALKPVTIRFGKPIAYEEFGFTDGSRKEIKYAAHVIAEQSESVIGGERMSIEVAKSAGFCFGIDRAVQMVYQLLDEGKKVYTLGPIIHNPQMIAELEARGVEILGNSRTCAERRNHSNSCSWCASENNG